MKSFCFYTVAHETRFIDSAIRCANSFLYYNKKVTFIIFLMEDCKLSASQKLELNAEAIVKNIKHYEYFTDPKVLKRKPHINICFCKFCIAPKYIPDGFKYICFVDADTWCLKKLDLDIIVSHLDDYRMCVTQDPKAEKHIEVLMKSKFGYNPHHNLYFNTGVVFWNSKMNYILIQHFSKFITENLYDLIKLNANDQTWLNIFYNNYRPLSEIMQIGWYWNCRGPIKHPYAYIWHGGGRSKVGIEKIAEEYIIWKEKTGQAQNISTQSGAK